jgi:hypothetical protein
MSKLWVYALFFLLSPEAVFAQRNSDYDFVVVPQTRIDARDLGHAPQDLIPDEESGITSLSVTPNGDLYGATSGAHSHLFLLNPQHGYVVPLGIIPGASAVTQALAISLAGQVFIGTAPAGHLLQYTPKDTDDPKIEIGKTLPVTDLGVAVAGESICALTMDQKANVIYGLTSPDAHLFAYSIANRSFKDLGVLATSVPFGEKFEKDKMVSRMLVVDHDGNVFASGQDGVFYEFEAGKQTLQRLAIHAPAVPGREPFTRVDAFLLDPSGNIYGGTSDGYLFRLDPRNETVTNLGKPLNQYRIAGLSWGPRGKLYGVGGDSSEMARLFSYDPSTASYELLGFIDVNRPPYYSWQAYEIGAVVSDSHGTVYLGENERISRLYLFFP